MLREAPLGAAVVVTLYSRIWTYLPTASRPETSCGGGGRRLSDGARAGRDGWVTAQPPSRTHLGRLLREHDVLLCLSVIHLHTAREGREGAGEAEQNFGNKPQNGSRHPSPATHRALLPALDARGITFRICEARTTGGS